MRALLCHLVMRVVASPVPASVRPRPICAQGSKSTTLFRKAHPK